MNVRLALDPESSCLSHPSAGFTGVHHLTQPFRPMVVKQTSKANPGSFSADSGGCHSTFRRRDVRRARLKGIYLILYLTIEKWEWLRHGKAGWSSCTALAPLSSLLPTALATKAVTITPVPTPSVTQQHPHPHRTQAGRQTDNAELLQLLT